ncbi:MAG TPA: Hsp70 family protein [Candidatus Hydrogenedentes bacterium]|nr:Hsp70 family protein [Candidatus Hydrogenedentota bacterium]
MADSDYIVGIDLGTTNSEIAVYKNGEVRIIKKNDRDILPSFVGITPEGALLVGEEARNQMLLYPERTVRSIKRKMGEDLLVPLGDKQFKPQEISAFILRELAQWAANFMGSPARRAVITVPAYFSDAQRQATREAGALAGLDVLRIINEPTAASLAYGIQEVGQKTVLVYDLGGGTFDVSIIAMESEVTEVLASHGNNHLGGDDFDALIAERLAQHFEQEHDINLRHDYPVAWSRIWRAAEEAKIKLSEAPFVTVREETLVISNGIPRHLELELSRQDYEALILPLVESTLDSVTKALQDAGKTTSDINAVLLVGGATRTPLVARILEERIGMEPRQDIHPDLCVALGAGVLASRLAGHDVDRVLVDVTPYTFGVRCIGEVDGRTCDHRFAKILRRNAPLPITRTELFYTTCPYQKAVDVEIFQGEDEDIYNNIPVGKFIIEDLKPVPEPSEILCRMALDINGILTVTAIEKCTQKSKHITIENAMRPMDEGELVEARKRIAELYASDVVHAGDTESDDTEEEKEITAGEHGDAVALMKHSEALMDTMHDEDKEEAIELLEQIKDALEGDDEEALREALDELKELIFYIEGK